MPLRSIALASALALFASVAPLARPLIEASGAPREALAEMTWLAGTWSGDMWGGVFTAHYSTPEGGVIISHSVLMKGEVESFYEFEVFDARDDGVHLQPFPKGRKAVGLSLASHDAGERKAVFENPDKDFPTRITYHCPSADELVITLSNIDDEGARSRCSSSLAEYVNLGGMKATRAALLVLLTAPFLAAGTPPQEEDQALPLLFFHARELDGRKHREGYRAAADMLRHLRDRQHGLLEAKGFLPQFYEGNMPYFSFAALAAPRDVDRMVQGYLADKEWQRLEDVLWEVTERELINDVLFPVAGRQGTGALIRTWRRSVALEGEFAEALRVARQLTEHLNGLSSSAATQLYVQDVDEFGVLHLITDYDASGAWAERQLRLLEDETYLALVDELNALMKEGSIRTEVLERITF